MNWLIAFIIGFVIPWAVTPSMKGPPFLALYLFLGFAILFLYDRLKWDKFGALFVYEWAGATRIYFGMQHGMHIFQILYMLMGVGLFIYIFSFVDWKNAGTGWGSGFSGGGCGSSGCGGGCGGCGGCG